MSMLKEYLTSEVSNWEVIGHPALLQRFVLRNGKVYTPTKRIGRRRPAKECFGNSTKAMMNSPHRGWHYVEGFAIHATQPLLAFHHAWITTDGSNAMDLTLDAAQYEYVGVAFDRATLLEETRRNRFYGLLDTGLGMNVALMFKMDPDLEAIVKAVKPSAQWRQAQQLVEEQSCEQS